MDSSNEDEENNENASIGHDVEKTVMEIKNSPHHSRVKIKSKT